MMDRPSGNVQQPAAGQSAPPERNPDYKPPVLEFRTENNNLIAYLRVKSIQPGQALSYAEVMDFLKAKRVTYGIYEKRIWEYCERSSYFTELVCAHGLPPVDGEDGTMEFLFKTKQDISLQQRQDGTVDYRDLGLIQNVKKGDALCRISPPKPGSDGIDVFGRPIHYKEGRVPRFPTGRNIAVSEDGLTLTALIDGCIEYKSMVLNILDSYIVHGNVDGSSGNIDTVGSVTVLGDVLEGFSVKAGGSITVRGMVEGARLQAEGNITIAKGMNGMGKGRLICGGDVTAKFFENCNIECEGDVYSDVIMNSIVKAGNAVILRGKNGLLLGGRCTTGRRVYANYIGNANNLKTDVIIESPALHKLIQKKGMEEQDEEIKKQMETLRNSRSLLQSQIDTLGTLLTIGHAHERVEKLINDNVEKQKKIDAQISALQEQIALTQEELIDNPADFNIVGVRVVYSGVKISIGAYTMLLKKDYSSVKFYPGKDDLTNGPILPSDRIDY